VGEREIESSARRDASRKSTHAWVARKEEMRTRGARDDCMRRMQACDASARYSVGAQKLKRAYIDREQGKEGHTQQAIRLLDKKERDQRKEYRSCTEARKGHTWSERKRGKRDEKMRRARERRHMLHQRA
jgi:hypothetical protein